MKKTTIFLFALLVAVACSSNDEQLLECGDGTVLDEEAEACIPQEQQCGDDEVLDAQLGHCVPAGHTYCGEGTVLDEQFGQCVATGEVSCGQDTVDEDGQCVATDLISCGEGTVVHDEVCRPWDEVCGEDTELTPSDGTCRPTGDICGEGTVFDVAERKCIAASILECGPGTRADGDHVCQPTRTFYEELAQDPDLDMTDPGATGHIDLAPQGQRFSFLGIIDAPQMVDGEPVQHSDVYELTAQAGQWLEITVFSLGLPEPAFEFFHLDGGETGFYRRSDLGAGIEVSRQVLIQEDGTYELAITNMPQLLDMAPPAGGEDWEYVGFVETMETPQAQPFDLVSDTRSGDIRDLSKNYYAVDGAGGIDVLALVFDTVPEHAQAELQIWTDETTVDSIFELDDDALIFEPPQDSFYLLLDRVYGAGDQMAYSFSARQGGPMDAGETLVEEVSLEAGDYVGFFQYNLQGHPLTATLMDEDDQALGEAQQLQVSTSDDEPISLYWYASQAQTVSLVLVNSSGNDLEFLAFDSFAGTADEMPALDGTLVEVDYEYTLARGHRHYFEVPIESGDLMAIRTHAQGASYLELRDSSGEVVREGRNAVIFETAPGDYLLSVEALQTLEGGFSLSSQSAEVFEVSESSQLPRVIPDNDPEGIRDPIHVESCPHVQEIEVSVDITHEWRSDLIIDVVAPGGESATIHDRAGGQANDVVGTFPDPDDPDLDSGEELYDLIGVNGSGTWELFVRDVAPQYDGILNGWGLELLCEG